MTTFRRMTDRDRQAAYALFVDYLHNDEFVRDSSAAYGNNGDRALSAALALFVERPDFGFIWMGFEGDEAVAVAIVSYAISTAVGGVVAKLEDTYVAPSRRSNGIGHAFVNSLVEELSKNRIARLDTSVHLQNARGKSFYETLGFRSLHEERLACVLR
jgi:GNAT superfamily N-acetyltransferase